jgi:hypothetical protein
MNRGLARFIADLFDLVEEHALFFGVIGVVGFLIGPSLLAFLERKERLASLFVWLYSLLLTPIIVLFMLSLGNPQDYCNDPLSHETFRWFYLLALPLVPLYAHYFRAVKLNHPVHYAFVLLMLSLGVFSLTLGQELFHFAYQSAQGHGVVYSGARAWECAYLNSASEMAAHRFVAIATLLFLVVQVCVLVIARRVKRRGVD